MSFPGLLCSVQLNQWYMEFDQTVQKYSCESLHACVDAHGRDRLPGGTASLTLQHVSADK